MLSVRPSLLGIVTFLILLEYFSSNKNIVGSILFYISHKFLTMFGLNSCNKHFCEGGRHIVLLLLASALALASSLTRPKACPAQFFGGCTKI